MKSKDPRTKLFRVLDALVDDLRHQSDEDLIKETTASGELPVDIAAQADTAFEAAMREAGRVRLARARAGIAQRRSLTSPKLSLSPERAREVFNRAKARNQGLAQTLAARGGREPSDDQVVEILQDWLFLESISEDDLKQ